MLFDAAIRLVNNTSYILIVDAAMAENKILRHYGINVSFKITRALSVHERQYFKHANSIHISFSLTVRCFLLLSAYEMIFRFILSLKHRLQ